MARYIDADKVMEEIMRIGGHNLCEWDTIGVKVLIYRQPTADVAPRAEVIEEYRKKVYAKMGKYTVMGREYIQRIMREVEKEYTEGQK